MVAQVNKSDLPALEFNPLSEPIPIGKIIELRNKQLTYKEIGKLLGCTDANICIRLQPFRHQLDNLQSVKDHEADTLAVVKHTILSHLSAEDIKKASAYQKVGMYALLDERERVKRTGMTQVIGYADYTKALSSVMEKRRQLEEELGISEAEVIDE